MRRVLQTLLLSAGAVVAHGGIRRELAVDTGYGISAIRSSCCSSTVARA